MAESISTSDWNSGDKSGLVNIGTHQLFMSARGPTRTPGQPVVIVEAGMGDSSAMWREVQKLASTFARIYLYDRAGLGQSETSPAPRTAESIASELSELLRIAAVDPPYILLCHSYGGILAREFLATRKQDDVQGLILIDTTTEHTYDELKPPWEDIFAILGTLDYFAVTELDTQNKLSPREWQDVKEEAASNERATNAERGEEGKSLSALAAKKQFDKQVLDHYPVVVIKANTLQDYSKMYEAGVAAGNGTESQRQTMRDFMRLLGEKEELVQREQMKLSSNPRFVNIPMAGHNVQFTHPELIVAELRSLVQQG